MFNLRYTRIWSELKRLSRAPVFPSVKVFEWLLSCWIPEPQGADPQPVTTLCPKIWTLIQNRKNHENDQNESREYCGAIKNANDEETSQSNFCWDTDTDRDTQTEIEIYMARNEQIFPNMDFPTDKIILKETIGHGWYSNTTKLEFSKCQEWAFEMLPYKAIDKLTDIIYKDVKMAKFKWGWFFVCLNTPLLKLPPKQSLLPSLSESSAQYTAVCSISKHSAV